MLTMFNRPSFGVILAALALIGAAGLGFLFGPGDTRPLFSEARLELGGALVSGVVLSGAFLVAERRLEREDQRHEERTAERQTRAQYQLALGMAETLADRDLSGLDLSGLQLIGRDFTASRFSKANLQRTNLQRANLTRAYLYRADLTRAYLTEANLTEAFLWGANLSGANLEKANLTGANLHLVKWKPSQRPKWPEGFDPPENRWNPTEDGTSPWA